MKTNIFLRVNLKTDCSIILTLDVGELPLDTVIPFAKSLTGATLNLAKNGMRWGEITMVIVSRSNAPIPQILHLSSGAIGKAIEVGEKMTLAGAIEAGISSMENGTIFRLGMKSFMLLFQIQFSTTA